MKKCNFYYLGLGLMAGAILGYMLNKKTSQLAFTSASGDTEDLRKGDKGRDIQAFQENLNLMLGETVQPSGMYDKKTAKAVQMMFTGTKALKDPATGIVDRVFIQDFNTIMDNLKKQGNS